MATTGVLTFLLNPTDIVNKLSERDHTGSITFLTITWKFRTISWTIWKGVVGSVL